MARTKQTARKCSGGGSRFRKETPRVASDTRPTGKAYLEALKQLAAKSQSPLPTEQAAAEICGAPKQSISETRTALPDLGPDLLQRIFAKLGPHPKDLVPLGAVSKQWRQVLNESTWKELCLKHAGGLVEELGYSHGADGPPGGWAGLYKLIICCPGCHFPTFEHVLQANALSENYDWRHGRGHVQAATKGFFKGKEAKEALYLATSDEIVISCLCSHGQAVEMCDIHEASAPPILACRGIVKSFESSKLAEWSGAAAFANQKGEAAGIAGEPVDSSSTQNEVVEAAGASDGEPSGGEMGEEADLDEEAASESEDFEAYPSGSEGEGSEGEVSSDTEEPEEKRPPCAYCGSPTFALPPKAFNSQFSDYDDLLSESFCDAYDRHEQARSMYESDDSEASNNDSMFVLGTGFVCLEGHIVLGVAGYPKLDEVAVVDSGESLELQRPQVVDFLLKFVVGGKTLSRKQGHRFIRGLLLDQLIQIEVRLVQLAKIWPAKEKEGCDKANEESDGADGESSEVIKEPDEETEGVNQEKESKDYKLFGYMYKRGNDPVGIVDVLGAGVPADLLEGLQAFVLTGDPGLAECEQPILGAFETQARRKEEAVARKIRSDAMDKAMRGAGFKQPFFRGLPSDLSKTLKAFIEMGDPSLAECERLILEERESREQAKASELRKNTIYQALRQAGFHPPSVPHLQSLCAYIQDPGAITFEEVIAQQRSARVQNVVSRVEVAAPRTSAQEQSHKCEVVTDGKSCTNQAAKGCSNDGCGPCCRKAAGPCRLGKHRKT
ncbi:F-box family protein [Klebsormidium nitens]|uniref:F-box family protein n=1 Tax=Klebsormidium nitens TaxID=105231 RepID=A0A1Y1IFU2_KLENI|nr:F-box family protein [Klebsormidium nitens]|eukprot:GAQ87636.1 F-box family protein [Klebsormidium nitens]